MSTHYAPVLWNRQKRVYDRVMLGLMGLYLALFTALQLVSYPNISPETLIIRATGTLAFLMLHVILSIGPLTRLNPRFLPLLYNRRHLGVSMFLVALIHGIFNLIQFHALGNVDPLVSLFTSNIHYGSLADFPFQVLGFFALLILFLMAATSHDFWLNNLSPRVWKSLHMMVYAAYAMLVFHVMLGVIQLENSAAWIGLTGLGMLWVTGLHVFAALVEKRRENHPAVKGSDGFVKVCELADIEEGRAKIVLADGQNIAVFKYDGKLSAVSNICRHQNGPLGEGKIVDGCITCPWHGYQYLPHNGQSPPPFTEKLETYDVKLVGNSVFVHPRPYPEGTERPAALIP
ncbi:MAG: ferric reductase-like transmembrane domain-containing protein [Phaeodactylibacter sp.]|nr:ferric reductase-like transmembrane domain-containing protein [Phaeodactylibacter sp.]MCB9301816.1 ferric reductase-like transmembrane domain-containing protein [Lewinellaceae bacterium]HQU60409.1 ferric reductase-like transmembrane domain-containing protein [Saprospiraceae bacterium]